MTCFYPVEYNKCSKMSYDIMVRLHYMEKVMTCSPCNYITLSKTLSWQIGAKD